MKVLGEATYMLSLTLVHSDNRWSCVYASNSQKIGTIIMRHTQLPAYRALGSGLHLQFCFHLPDA